MTCRDSLNSMCQPIECRRCEACRGHKRGKPRSQKSTNKTKKATSYPSPRVSSEIAMSVDKSASSLKENEETRLVAIGKVEVGAETDPG